jgi:hypothetical protein
LFHCWKNYIAGIRILGFFISVGECKHWVLPSVVPLAFVLQVVWLVAWAGALPISLGDAMNQSYRA